MGIDVKYKCGSLQHGQFIKYKFFGWIIKYILFICKYIPLLPNFEEHIYTYDIFDEIPNYDDIIYISCSYNQLTELPKLPNSLKQLYCSDNKLTSLPEFPNLLQNINCSNNKLKSLPELPKSLKWVKHDNNPFIKKGKNNYLVKIIYM